MTQDQLNTSTSPDTYIISGFCCHYSLYIRLPLPDANRPLSLQSQTTIRMIHHIKRFLTPCVSLNMNQAEFKQLFMTSTHHYDVINDLS